MLTLALASFALASFALASFALASFALQTLVLPGIIQLLVVIVILGFCLWLVQTYVPMPQPIKVFLTVIVVLLIVVMLLRSVGLF